MKTNKMPPKGMMPKRSLDGKTLKRLISYLFKYYKKGIIIILIGILISSACGSASAMFMERIVAHINEGLKEGYNAIEKGLYTTLIFMASVYIIGLATSFISQRIGAVLTQDLLRRIRVDMFKHMQTLPVRYFDTTPHGETMSCYTNDIDTLRQLVSQSLPQIFASSTTIIVLLIFMLSRSIWLTLVVLLAVVAILTVTKKIGGRSGKYFIKQQRSIAKVEGYIEEMMKGQKVVKVFNHEEEAKNKFDELNNQLFNDAYSANKFANILMPILGNIGNILYVLVAFVGMTLLLLKVPNIRIGSINVVKIEVVVAFLALSRQFSMNVNQVSQQINSIVMGLAGAKRVFNLLDEPSEVDEGYVTLVNVKYDENGNMQETNERTHIWAWKHPHSDGTLTYELLKGDIRFFDVDFGYNPDKIVLHNVSIYAKPGQKIAFVGATGAGKTTITNLINRFYDIADGKIRYDGININKIKKDDLRKSIGIVLQDTNLFTGTVRENIRYGRLDASNEEVIEAAKIANAHDFITRLPNGYDTVLSGDGTNLSQGQRQLLSIARAAIADAPVMILDEATSSIDTRTELLVQEGMDELMKGRTVLVIAHRLSTVQNSNAIMVLDHGRIIERGDHDDLISQKGIYYQLYTGGFELE